MYLCFIKQTIIINKMKGERIYIENSDIISSYEFILKKNKYKFISVLFLWKENEKGISFKSGRFDFNYNDSEKLTNKGISTINKYKINVVNCIDKLFLLGCEYVEIQSYDNKSSLRLKLYERILKEYYKIEHINENLFILTK